VTGTLLPESGDTPIVSKGRAVHLACPAGFIAELPFERWLRRMTDKPVLWLTACEHDHPHQLFAVHVSTRQYARIVHHWAEAAGLDSSAYGTHSMRRTKATLIYKRTKNLRAVQLLLGHSKLESTVRYLGIEVDDALEISEQTEI